MNDDPIRKRIEENNRKAKLWSEIAIIAMAIGLIGMVVALVFSVL